MVNNEEKEHEKHSALLLIIFSSIAIIIFTFFIIESYIFRKYAIFSTGKVISHSKYKKGDNKIYSFTPIIEYKVGETIMKVRGNTQEKKKDVDKIGEEISICYNPKYAQDCRLGLFKEAYQSKLIALGVSFLCLIMGTYKYETDED